MTPRSFQPAFVPAEELFFRRHCMFGLREKPFSLKTALLGAVAVIALLAVPAIAQTVAATGTAPAAASAPAPTPIDQGSTAWILVSSALVLFMVPGLAMFYGGMVRAKNVLNAYLCCLAPIGVIGFLWVA